MNNRYASKWVLQRITAVILIPLTFWFIYNCISFQYLQFQEMKLFFQSLPDVNLRKIKIGMLDNEINEWLSDSEAGGAKSD